MAQGQNSRIRHSVIFKLKGSADEQDFFKAAKELAGIPGVEKLECLRQTSKKNKFQFGISMEFANQLLYDQYNTHPDHVAFVNERWMKEVDDFMEIDFEVIA